MGIWDKSKLLGGLRMDTEYAEGQTFVLYGMKVAGEIDLENGMEEATKTLLLTEEVAPNGDGGYELFTKGDGAKVVGTLSGPIAQMAAAAEPEDFPVVVAWQAVATKTRDKATVLDYRCAWEGDKAPKVTPPEWNSA